MRIDSKLFVLVLALVTAALCAVMLGLWKRLSRRTPGAILGRIALVLGSQLAMAATILAGVNIYFGFYTSWQDLVGGGAQSFELKVRPLPEVASADAAQISVSGADFTTTTGPLAMHGLRSGISAELTVYAPAGYQDTAQAGTRYPVIVVDSTGSAGPSGTAVTAPEAQSADNVPALLVFVSNSGEPAIPCTNVAGSANQQGALFWDQDLRTAIATRFRATLNPADWAVVGGGANAACAGTLAVLSSDYYAAAATIGPWAEPASPVQDPPAIADSPGRWLQLYPGPPSDILLVDADQQTKSIFTANPGALRVQAQSGLSAHQVFVWLTQAIGQSNGRQPDGTQRWSGQ